MATSLALRLNCDGGLADKKLGTVRGSATAVPAELHPRMEPGSRKGAEISPDLDVATHRSSVPWCFPAALVGGVNEAPVSGALPYQLVFGPSLINSEFFLLNIWSGSFKYPPLPLSKGLNMY